MSLPSRPPESRDHSPASESSMSSPPPSPVPASSLAAPLPAPARMENSAGGAEASLSRSTSDANQRHGTRRSSQGRNAAAARVPGDFTHRGETWMDFLRESDRQPIHHGRSASAYTAQAASQHYPQHAPAPRAGPADWQHRTHSDSTMARSNAERKRRLTTPESPMRLPTGLRVRPDARAGGDQGPVAGSSSQHPILLDSSPELASATLPRPHLPSHSSSQSRSSFLNPSRRESDIVLPPWQPDSEVTQCPVCGNHFTFFYRKHHCRKCGRVVCSACSPHRITIPRQFIVHPPSESPLGISILDLTGDDNSPTNDSGDSDHPDHNGYRNSGLGGGEEVRVCNPCVPDPNYNPPPQPQSPPPSLARGFTPSGYSTFPARDSSMPPPYQPVQPRNYGYVPTGHYSSRSSQEQFSQGQDYRTRNRRTTIADLWPPTQPPTHLPMPSSYSHSHAHSRSHGIISNLQYRNQEAFQHRHTQPPPRRQIPEEDECPICFLELPAKGPNGDTTAREQHITACIAEQSGTATQNQTQPQSPTTPADASTPIPAAGPSNSLPTASGARNPNRQSGLGLFAYTATEKDCLQDGAPVECEICFEEFEVGERLARLSCWCRFHDKCIRGWWERKGERACPTHDLTLGGGG